MSNEIKRRVAVVGGARTPFAKAGAALKDYSALELATHSVNGALEKLDLDPATVDQLVYGTVVVDPAIPHLAREVNFKSKLPAAVRALTITDNCISGTSAIASVHDAIVTGRAETGIAGGVESMSNPPVLFTKRASRIFLDAGRERTLGGRLKSLARLRPGDFKPWAYGIAEPSTGLTMGEHTEITVKEWQISREEQDAIAYQSHMNAHRATEDGRLPAEIHPLNGIHRDLLIRPDTSMEALAKLAPVFDRSGTGTITARWGRSRPAPQRPRLVASAGVAALRRRADQCRAPGCQVRESGLCPASRGRPAVPDHRVARRRKRLRPFSHQHADIRSSQSLRHAFGKD